MDWGFWDTNNDADSDDWTDTTIPIDVLLSYWYLGDDRYEDILSGIDRIN